MNVNFDELQGAARVSPLIVMEHVLGVTCHGVTANEHVVSIMVPSGNVDDNLVNTLMRMEITHKGKTMRVDRINDGVASNEGNPYQYRSFGFAVPDAKRGPTEAHMEQAKKVFRAMEREAGSRFNPTSILLENNPKELEDMIVEAPIGSGRGQGAGFTIKPRYQVGK